MSKLTQQYHRHIEPIVAKIMSSDAFREAFDLAKVIIPQVAFEMLQNPGATDDDRRSEVVRRLKEALIAKHPGQGWFINVAVDFAVDHLRDLLKSKKP